MNKLSEIFNIKIDNPKLFEEALTHPSYSKDFGLEYNYERMEFLGDAVLKLSISDILYKKFPKYTEGNMSKIRSIVVSDAILFEICEKIGLSALILLPKHEEKQGCRKLESVCACTFEAVLGAYYLDGKLSELLGFIEKTFEFYIEDVDKNFEKFNAKAILQEYTQSETKTVPIYKIINNSGPAHNQIFETAVFYQDKQIACGIGKTKKDSEQQAAYNACLELGIVKCQK